MEIIDNNQFTLESNREFYKPIKRCKLIEKKIEKIAMAHFPRLSRFLGQIRLYSELAD